MRSNKIFIGGSQHSGTTMLFSMLKNHSKCLETTGESRIMENINRLSNNYGQLNEEQKKSRLLNAFSPNNSYKHLKESTRKHKNELVRYINERKLNYSSHFIDDMNETYC